MSAVQPRRGPVEDPHAVTEVDPLISLTWRWRRAAPASRPPSAETLHCPRGAIDHNVKPSRTTTTRPARAPTPGGRQTGTPGSPLPNPAPLAPFSRARRRRRGRLESRRTNGRRSAGGLRDHIGPAGRLAACRDRPDGHRLLSALLYSGSKSPGGGPYRYTAPIQPAEAASVVAAFNGGFVMNVAGGGYYTEGSMIDPLVPGAASLVIYSDGSVNVGAWGSDVAMTPSVVSVRQNLVPLVAAGQPTPQAASPNWQAWGTRVARPRLRRSPRHRTAVALWGWCHRRWGPGLRHRPDSRSAAAGSASGARRGRAWHATRHRPQLDRPVTYDPPIPGGLAAPSNGSQLLAATVQGPGTFFEPSWARDFITMSARPAPKPNSPDEHG